jgi:hypothetical protein
MPRDISATQYTSNKRIDDAFQFAMMMRPGFGVGLNLSFRPGFAPPGQRAFDGRGPQSLRTILTPLSRQLDLVSVMLSSFGKPRTKAGKHHFFLGFSNFRFKRW